MSLKSTAERLLKEFSSETKQRVEGTREYCVAFCREQSMRQVLHVLNMEPIENEILWCRGEIQKLALKPFYISDNHRYVLQKWDQDNKPTIVPTAEIPDDIA